MCQSPQGARVYMEELSTTDCVRTCITFMEGLSTTLCARTYIESRQHMWKLTCMKGLSTTHVSKHFQSPSECVCTRDTRQDTTIESNFRTELTCISRDSTTCYHDYAAKLVQSFYVQTYRELTIVWRGCRLHIFQIKQSSVCLEGLSTTRYVSKLNKAPCVWRASRQHAMCPNWTELRVFGGTLDNMLCVQIELRVYGGTLNDTLCPSNRAPCVWRDSRQHAMCPNWT